MNLFKAVPRKLRENRGSAYVEHLLLLFIMALGLCLLVNVIGIGVDYFKVVVYTNNLVDSAANKGSDAFGSEEINSLASDSGLDGGRLTYTWDAQYFDTSSGKLAFRQPFTLTIRYACKLPLFFGDSSKTSFAVPVTYVGKGSSGVFWK